MVTLNTQKKLLLVLALLIGVAGLLVWFTQIQVTKIDSQLNAPEIEIESQVESQTIESDQQIEYTLTATSEMTAEELLDQSLTVEYQDFGSAGKFVKSIDGVSSSDAYFWGFYVNDAFAEVGVSQTELLPGDTITFRYEKIEPIQ